MMGVYIINVRKEKFKNASKTNNIDDLGKQSLYACITNRRGCVTQKKLSNIYTGIYYDYSDSDGECTLGLSIQKVRVCNDAQRKRLQMQFGQPIDLNNFQFYQSVIY
ncbi:unnamed protein product [Paramecium pentaurelia]|uniref:Uncharacterized protein n=1 Tax=Paramecium pentaurelia TaxID=43138 RepID=A0A8S1UH80_9CILI|nr:unnamed protein product [Paramecium pentaurelia]